jgi:hypothetical protein
LLGRQHALAQDWRKLHTQQALLPPSQRARASRQLLRRAETALSHLTRARAELRAELRAPADCTGTAFVVFRRRTDAARCVRHFGLIRRHERSRDGGVAGATVDFRQLYFRTAHKLGVSRACEPSDILWRSLRVTKASSQAANARATVLVFLVACVSTAAITAANFMGTAHSTGALTTLWVTAVVIASNVVIFNLVSKRPTLPLPLAPVSTLSVMGTAHSTGALTTLWVTAVVIASNVVIFNLVSNTHTTKGGNETATNRGLEGAAAGALDGRADNSMGDRGSHRV